MSVTLYSNKTVLFFLTELFEGIYSKSISSGIKKVEVDSSLDLKEEIELTDEVEQSIKERLRSLGYI